MTTVCGEAVFNTSMSGYQEILTDPSYFGQIVTMTVPQIGNYGVNEEDLESSKPHAAGFVVRELSPVVSNWRATSDLGSWLAKHGIPGIEGVDTRALTKRIRSGGVTMGAVSTEGPEQALAAVAAAQRYDETDFVARVTTKAPYAWGREGRKEIGEPGAEMRLRLVVVDCGLKHNILRRFAALGVRSVVLPSTATADEVMGWRPDGVLFSPGPGDPARLPNVVGCARDLIGRLPVFGICLGNQVLCQAVGGRTYKLKFGHRGSNHPVKDLLDGSVTITSQNHGYAVDPDSLAGSGAEVTQVNLNDGTVEGIRLPNDAASSIQYHPEAAPGPWDSRKYFVQFVEAMERTRAAV